MNECLTCGADETVVRYADGELAEFYPEHATHAVEFHAGAQGVVVP